MLEKAKQKPAKKWQLSISNKYYKKLSDQEERFKIDHSHADVDNVTIFLRVAMFLMVIYCIIAAGTALNDNLKVGNMSFLASLTGIVFFDFNVTSLKIYFIKATLSLGIIAYLYLFFILFRDIQNLFLIIRDHSFKFSEKSVSRLKLISVDFYLIGMNYSFLFLIYSQAIDLKDQVPFAFGVNIMLAFNQVLTLMILGIVCRILARQLEHGLALESEIEATI